MPELTPTPGDHDPLPDCTIEQLTKVAALLQRLNIMLDQEPELLYQSGARDQEYPRRQCLIMHWDQIAREQDAGDYVKLISLVHNAWYTLFDCSVVEFNENNPRNTVLRRQRQFEAHIRNILQARLDQEMAERFNPHTDPETY